MTRRIGWRPARSRAALGRFKGLNVRKAERGAANGPRPERRRIRWTRAFGPLVLGAIVLGALPGAGGAGQEEPAEATPSVAPARPAVPCAVPDPADRPPLTDGTDGTNGTAVQN